MHVHTHLLLEDLMSMFRTSAFAILTLVAAAPVARSQEAPRFTEKSTAMCKDGTWSETRTKRGACSGHQGVKKWVGVKPSKAYARCKDGEYWMTGVAQGACSGHDGVMQWYRKDKKDEKKEEKKEEKKG